MLGYFCISTKSKVMEDNFGDDTCQDVTDPNAILFDESAFGESYGVMGIGGAASDRSANNDADRVEELAESFERVGEEYDLPPALLAGIASRESHVGDVLGRNGSQPGWGDHDNAYGMMQIDHRYHTVDESDGPLGEANIEQGAEIISGYRDDISEAHPDWTEAQQLRGAVTAYNSGVRNVQTLGGLDEGTTGNDYSGDVWARAQVFAEDVFDDDQECEQP
jgi:soluble lytic murein transglycosylase-like protein